MQVPADLESTGRQMFESLTGGRDLSGAHLAMIVNACRMADRIDRLNEAVGGRLTVTNSQSTETINPLISEARMMTSALSQVLAKLGVAELPKVRSGDKSIRDQLAEARARRVAG